MSDFLSLLYRKDSSSNVSESKFSQSMVLYAPGPRVFLVVLQTDLLSIFLIDDTWLSSTFLTACWAPYLSFFLALIFLSYLL
jgi:hypothetical protein